jgi:hypothetical protein
MGYDSADWILLVQERYHLKDILNTILNAKFEFISAVLLKKNI